MKYYINLNKKSDFNFLGEITEKNITEGNGLKFIKEYINEYPNIVTELVATDENGNETSLYDFLLFLNKKKQIFFLEEQLKMSNNKNRNYLDGYTQMGIENKIKDLKKSLNE